MKYVARRGVLAILAILTLSALSSCSTFLSDIFILTEASPQEKSALLTAKGIEMYDSLLMERNELKRIEDVRMVFVNALRADPLNKEAETYLARIKAFRTERFSTYLGRAKALKEKKTRTERENYDLCLYIQRALDISSLSPEALKLKLETSEIRRGVVKKRAEELEAQQRALFAETAPARIEAAIPKAVKLITEITQVDPGNKDAGEARKAIDAFVAGRVKEDVDRARAALSKKDWPAAESSILRAERSLKGLGRGRTPEVSALKYQIYYKWAQALYAERKYEAADSKLAAALAVTRSPEALDLKTRISKARSTKDYDAELPDALAEIDARIARGDLAGAWNLAETGLSRAKVPANREKLSARKATIMSKLAALYNASVADYNAEDYESARDGFKTVVAIAPDYLQASAYLAKANNKLRALEGE